MNKKERYERYKYLQGLSAWDIGTYKNPDLKVVVNDGPNGLRKPATNLFTDQSGVIKTVCTPTISALAASFSYDACYNAGQILANECLYHNTNILLGPGVNIKRNALCGRNFEYFSEDPFLTGILASGFVNGLESNGVGACIKHFACNNQEFARLVNSSEVSLRALNEIYLRSFKYILKYSNPTAIMTSYNKINGVYVNESEYLLQKKIRDEYKYKGLIMSDWCAVSNKGKTIRCGLNIEMPISIRSNEYFDKSYNVEFDESDLIKRDNETYYALNKYNSSKRLDSIDLDNLHSKALKIAEETMVLVKNDNYLPLKEEERVLFLGYFVNHSRYVGGGSGWVNAYNAPSFLEVLKVKECDYDFIQLYDEDKLLVTLEELEEIKNDYDKVVLFLGQYENDESEGYDRKGITLREHQLKACNLCKKVFGDFASVIIGGSVIDLEVVFKNSKSVMISYLAGEAQSEAIFNNLYGIHNPSGRLPETWISSLEQNPIYNEILKKDVFYSYYDEDIFVGYRYYDNVKNGFMLPFGYGLSYSKFRYFNFSVVKDNNKIIAKLDVENVSKISGFDVIQIYISKVNSSVYRPYKELKGFKKVYLNSNETTHVEINVDIEDIGVFSIENDDYVIENGKYLIHFARNSFEIERSIEIELDGESLIAHNEPDRLSRKESPKYYNLDTPLIFVADNIIFKEELKKYGLDTFFDNNKWIIYEPFRKLAYENDFMWSFEYLEEIISKMNENI